MPLNTSTANNDQRKMTPLEFKADTFRFSPCVCSARGRKRIDSLCPTLEAARAYLENTYESCGAKVVFGAVNAKHKKQLKKCMSCINGQNKDTRIAITSFDNSKHSILQNVSHARESLSDEEDDESCMIRMLETILHQHMVDVTHVECARTSWSKDDIVVAIYRPTADVMKELQALDVELEPEDFMGNSPLCAAVCCDDLVLVDYFLQTGVDIRRNNYAGETVLFQAVRKKNVEIVTRLLEHKICSTSKNYVHESALYDAVRMGNSKILTAMLRYFTFNELANENVNGDTVLDCAVKMNEYNAFVIILKQYKAQKIPGKYLFVAVEHKRRRMVQHLLHLGVRKNWVNSNGETAMMKCIEHQDVEMMNILLSSGKGEWIDESDNDKNLLVCAALNGSAESAQSLLAIGYEHGIRMAAFCAMKLGSIETFRCFLEHGVFDSEEIFISKDNFLEIAVKDYKYGARVALEDNGVYCNTITEDRLQSNFIEVVNLICSYAEPVHFSMARRVIECSKTLLVQHRVIASLIRNNACVKMGPCCVPNRDPAAHTSILSLLCSKRHAEPEEMLARYIWENLYHAGNGVPDHKHISIPQSEIEDYAELCELRCNVRSLKELSRITVREHMKTRNFVQSVVILDIPTTLHAYLCLL